MKAKLKASIDSFSNKLWDKVLALSTELRAENVFFRQSVLLAELRTIDQELAAAHDPDNRICVKFELSAPGDVRIGFLHGMRTIQNSPSDYLLTRQFDSIDVLLAAIQQKTNEPSMEKYFAQNS